MSSNPWDMFQTDPNLEQKGVRIDYGAFYFMIARAGGANDKFKTLMKDAFRPYERAIELGQMDEKVQVKLTGEAFAEGAVLGWGSVVDGEDVPGVLNHPSGKKIDFSADACKDLFAELPELLGDLLEQATKRANYARLRQKADAGN